MSVHRRRDQTVAHPRRRPAVFRRRPPGRLDPRGGAAEGVASSAVNRQILKLEAEIGVPLFERFASGITLTSAGEALARHVLVVLQDLKRARSDIEGLEDARAGHGVDRCGRGRLRRIAAGRARTFARAGAARHRQRRGDGLLRAAAGGRGMGCGYQPRLRSAAPDRSAAGGAGKVQARRDHGARPSAGGPRPARPWSLPRPSGHHAERRPLDRPAPRPGPGTAIAGREPRGALVLDRADSRTRRARARPRLPDADRAGAAAGARPARLRADRGRRADLERSRRLCPGPARAAGDARPRAAHPRGGHRAARTGGARRTMPIRHRLRQNSVLFCATVHDTVWHLPSPLSVDLRERVVAAVLEGASCHGAAARFATSASSVSRWSARFRQEGEIAPRPSGGNNGSPGIAAQAAQVLALCAQQPRLVLREMRERLAEQEVQTSTSALSRFFARHGLTRKKGLCTPPSSSART